MKKHTLIRLCLLLLLVCSLIFVHMLSARSIHTVRVQPLLPYDDGELAVLQSQLVANGLVVEIMPEQKMPLKSWYEPRKRYRAPIILDELAKGQKSRMFHDAGVLGFTSADISTTHRGQKDWGIFGLANSWLGTCVVSTFRLKHGNPEPEVFNRRVGIVAMHELGHLRGLPHCENQECVMQDCAGTIKTVDKKMLGWCENCRCKE